MAKKKEEKGEEEKWIEKIEYERFIDYWVMNYRKGMFALDLGQAISEPITVFLRIWIDPTELKGLVAFLQEQIKSYEKDFGKIE